MTNPAIRAFTRLSFIPLIFGFAAVVMAAGASDRPYDVASKIRSLEWLKFDAQKERNNVALNTLLDDGLMWVDVNGTLSTKAGYMERLHESATAQVRVQSLTVKVFDQMAIVVGIYDERGIKNNRPYHQRCRFIDTWSLKRDKWMLIAVTATSTIS